MNTPSSYSKNSDSQRIHMNSNQFNRKKRLFSMMLGDSAVGTSTPQNWKKYKISSNDAFIPISNLVMNKFYNNLSSFKSHFEDTKNSTSQNNDIEMRPQSSSNQYNKSYCGSQTPSQENYFSNKSVQKIPEHIKKEMNRYFNDVINTEKSQFYAQCTECLKK